jgi:hypothetical protein
MPVRFTDAQLDQIVAAAQPLTVDDRALFLRAVADILGDTREPGDGEVFRAIRAGQRAHFDPPSFHHAGQSKYR